jgi:hypothetical protein
MRRANRFARGAVFAVALSVLCAAPALLAAEAPDISGTIEGKATVGIDDNGTWNYFLEEFSNLRLKAYVGEMATINIAANLIASSDDGNDFSSDAEIERLYFSLAGDVAGFDAGLMRLPFGFGQGFRPVDVYAMPNPLYPDARSRGVLAAALSLYPAGAIKFRGFLVDGDDALDARDSLLFTSVNRPSAGVSAEMHVSALSAQTLYVYDLPETAGSRSRSRIGASVKFDLLAGFTIDALFTVPEESRDADECVEAAISADWSFDSGKVYLLGQYFYNGDGGIDGPDTDYVFIGKHYALGSVNWQYSDYTAISGGVTVALDDRSLVPSVSVSHEPFQGMTVTLSLRSPLDGGAGSGGEFGPERSASRGSASIGAKLKF